MKKKEEKEVLLDVNFSWGVKIPKREFAGLIFGEASLVDMNKLHLEWRRLSLQEENLIPAGEIMRYEFNGFTFFFTRLLKAAVYACGFPRRIRLLSRRITIPVVRLLMKAEPMPALCK